MNRWAALVLLLLLPLTMAPRTSINNDAWILDVSTPRATVRVGAVMPVTITLTNNTSETTRLMPALFTATVDGASGVALVRPVSRGCEGDGDVAGCWVPSLEPGESVTYRMLGRSSVPGQLELAVAVRGGEGLLPATWAVTE